MKILFLSHYFPPEVNAPATRTYEHCKRWVEMGHEVTVVSCVPHHPMGEAYPGYKNKFFHVEYKDGIRSIKLLTYITANEGFVKRTANYVFYMLMCILVTPFLSKADVVVSTTPQFFNGLAGYFVSKIKRAKWVLEVRDLWPESIVAVGAIKNKTVIALLESIEKFIYRKADKVVPVTNSFKTHIVANGAKTENVHVIRNGVDLTFFNSDLPKDMDFVTKHNLDNKFVASYVGTHGMAHGLDIIIGAAEILKERDDIIFMMAGDGSERKRLQEAVKSKGLNNVLMLGQLPKDQMPKLWSVSDVSLVVLKNLDLFLTVIPSKIFESMAMKKPIIMGVKGESREIVEESGSALMIEPENAQDLANAVVKLAESTDLKISMGESGYEYVSKVFDRRELAEQMLEVLDV